MGSALLEVLVATGLLVSLLTAVLPLTSVALLRAHVARHDTVAGQLARQRLDHLSVLTLRRDAGGVMVDVHAGFAGDGFTQTGSGLSPTGLAPLTSDVSGGVDWLDGRGQPISFAADRPPAARYRRRWGVLEGPGSDCVQLWVTVTPLDERRERAAQVGTTRCAWGIATP